VFDDVIDDVRRSVLEAAGFLHLGLVLDLRLMTRGKPDHLAQELLVNLAQDLRG
jgi:hypothetical protein